MAPGWPGLHHHHQRQHVFAGAKSIGNATEQTIFLRVCVCVFFSFFFFLCVEVVKGVCIEQIRDGGGPVKTGRTDADAHQLMGCLH